jgi:hypothetical protein
MITQLRPSSMPPSPLRSEMVPQHFFGRTFGSSVAQLKPWPRTCGWPSRGGLDALAQCEKGSVRELVVYVGLPTLPMPRRCKLPSNSYPSRTCFSSSYSHLSLTGLFGSGCPMVSTPRPRLTPHSFLVTWTSWVLDKSGRFKCLEKANSLHG